MTSRTPTLSTLPGKSRAGTRSGRHRGAAIPGSGLLTPDQAVTAYAGDVQRSLDQQDEVWSRGFTRRRMLAGVGAVCVAGIASQFVSTRLSFGAPADAGINTLVAVFFRGGIDGLSVVVPTDQPYYDQRPGIAIPQSRLIQIDQRFGMHPVLAPLQPFLASGQLGFVHAAGAPDASRSHFEAEETVERGVGNVGTHTGWLTRGLEAMGPGTTFRAIHEGSSLPRSLAGEPSALTLRGIDSFDLRGFDGVRDRTVAALGSLYTGLDSPYAAQVLTTLDGLAAAQAIAAVPYEPANGAEYPDSGFANAMTDIARLIKANAGLRVATVNVGGWDMHTNMGNVDAGDMTNSLGSVGQTLAAFATDLGTQLDDVTVVTMSEFGRRLGQNDNGGTDHGAGNAMILLGGGVVGNQVHGVWPGLEGDALDQGDLAVANDFRNVFGELLQKRMGVGALDGVFPDLAYTPLGVAT